MALDPGLAVLNNYGYNLTQRHDVRLAPLDLLGRDDVLERLGPLTELFEANERLPRSGPPEPAVALNGQQSGHIHVSVGRRLLVNIVTGLGGQVNLDVLSEISEAVRFIRFEFKNVVNIGVGPVDVARYLESTRPHDSVTVERYLLDPDTDAFVVTDAMESNTTRAQMLGIGGDVIRLDPVKLQAAFSGNLELRKDFDWIEVQGGAAATFAFRCYRIERRRGGWSLAGHPSSRNPRPVLIAPGTRILVRPTPAAA